MQLKVWASLCGVMDVQLETKPTACFHLRKVSLCPIRTWLDARSHLLHTVKLYNKILIPGGENVCTLSLYINRFSNICTLLEDLSFWLFTFGVLTISLENKDITFLVLTFLKRACSLLLLLPTWWRWFLVEESKQLNSHGHSQKAAVVLKFKNEKLNQ